MSCYIFYTHNTFDQYHVDMAIESLSAQNVDFKFDELVVYNNSDQLTSENILKSFEKQGANRYFLKTSVIEDCPRTNKVCVDLEYQKNNIKGHDWYFCHKSDFYLSQNLLTNFLKNPLVRNESPHYLNFCKFDTRETTTSEILRYMSSLSSFEEMVRQEFTSFSDFHKYAPDISVNHLAIGYRGNKNRPTFDGVMHAYNEKAREKLEFNSFWSDEDIFKLRMKGINMEMDKSLLFVLHMFHDIGRTDKMKSIAGHRF